MDDDGSGSGMTLGEWMERRDSALLADYTPSRARVPSDKLGLSGVSTPHGTGPGSKDSKKSSARTQFSLPTPDALLSDGLTYSANLLAISPYAGPGHVGTVPRRKRPTSSQLGKRPGTAMSALTNDSSDNAVDVRHSRSAGGTRSGSPTLYLASPVNKAMADARRAHSKEKKFLEDALAAKDLDTKLMRKQLKQRDEAVASLHAQVQGLQVLLKQQQDTIDANSKTKREGRSRSGPPLAKAQTSPDSPMSPQRLAALSAPTRPREKVVTDGLTKSYMQELEMAALQGPSPGLYDIEKCYEANRKKVSALAFSPNKIVSYLDKLVEQAQDSPGPGSYEGSGNFGLGMQMCGEIANADGATRKKSPLSPNPAKSRFVKGIKSTVVQTKGKDAAALFMTAGALRGSSKLKKLADMAPEERAAAEVQATRAMLAKREAAKAAEVAAAAEAAAKVEAAAEAAAEVEAAAEAAAKVQAAAEAAAEVEADAEAAAELEAAAKADEVAATAASETAPAATGVVAVCEGRPAAETNTAEPTPTSAADAEKPTTILDGVSNGIATTVEAPSETPAEVAAAMAALWDTLPKGGDGTVPWAECWEHLLTDDNIARAVVDNAAAGKDDADSLSEGRKLLAAVKYLQTCHETSDSAVDQASFLRFLGSAEVAAARAHVELQAYAPSADLTRLVEEFWAGLPKESIPDIDGGTDGTPAENRDPNQGRIERLACWKLIMANKDLAVVLGNGDEKRGQALLASMQHIRALDANRDGYIDHLEFKRLLSADVLRSAARWVDAMLKGITPASTLATSSGGAGIENEDEEDDINVDIGIDAAMNEINTAGTDGNSESSAQESAKESSETSESRDGVTPLGSRTEPLMSPSSRWKLASHAKYCVGERDRHATELVLLAARLTAASNAAQDSIRESAEATRRETLDEDAEDEAVDAAAAAAKDADAIAVADVAVEEEGASSTAAVGDSDNKNNLLAPGGAKPSKDSRKKSAMRKLKAGGMAAGGFSAGSLVAQLAAPPGLAAAELVLYKLAQQTAIEADSKSTGFGTTHRAANVNFYHMFNQLDLDQNGGVSKDEFTKTVRRALGVKTSALSDEELNQVFDAIDTSDDGAISLREFSAFAKGATYSTQIRHAAESVFQLGGGAGGGKSKSKKDAVVGAQPNTLGHSSVEAGGGDVLTYGTPDHPELLKEGPHLSDRLALAGGDQGPEGLDKVHLVLWHLSQHVAKAEEAKSGGGSSNFSAKTSATHPANISYAKLFRQLDLDNSTLVTRDEWAVTLRRHIGVGKHVSDADLDQIFNEIDQDSSGSISFCEFAAFARGASDSAAMRGVAHELQEARAALRSAKKAQSAFGASRAAMVARTAFR